jgi:hypothetical protein
MLVHDQGLHVVQVTSIMERAGIRMDAESSNSLMAIMAEECWRGGGSIVDVEALCEDCRNDEVVEMNAQHYRSVSLNPEPLTPNECTALQVG